MTVRKYKQGDRCILVIEGCVGEVATKVNKILRDLFAEGPAEQEIPGLEPEDMSEPECPDISTATEIRSEADLYPDPPPGEAVRRYPVEGHSKTLNGAMIQRDAAAIVKCYIDTANAIDRIDREAHYTCRRYLNNDLHSRNPQTTPVNEIKRFCVAYGPFLAEAMRDLIAGYGYSNGEEFFSRADEPTIRDAYQSAIDVCLRALEV